MLQIILFFFKPIIITFIRLSAYFRKFTPNIEHLFRSWNIPIVPSSLFHILLSPLYADDFDFILDGKNRVFPLFSYSKILNLEFGFRTIPTRPPVGIIIFWNVPNTASRLIHSTNTVLPCHIPHFLLTYLFPSVNESMFHPFVRDNFITI